MNTLGDKAVQVNGKDVGGGARIVIVLPHGRRGASRLTPRSSSPAFLGCTSGTWVDGTGTITITGYAP